ncbi:hypothetical protein AYX15_04423 [Cryptococcus neoformans]|nr:hypothetical protein AYX15_04423 [Cryptococcus neoformans var. grubii]
MTIKRRLATESFFASSSPSPLCNYLEGCLSDIDTNLDKFRGWLTPSIKAELIAATIKQLSISSTLLPLSFPIGLTRRESTRQGCA